VPAGVVHVSDVSLATTTLVAAAPPKVTTFVPGALSRKPVPVRVTLVPPLSRPLAGRTAVRVGCGWYVYPAGSVDEPLAFETATLTLAPAGPAGTTHVIVESLATTTALAAAPSKVTVLRPGELFWKPAPHRAGMS
jgi:hypothetical protein